MFILQLFSLVVTVAHVTQLSQVIAIDPKQYRINGTGCDKWKKHAPIKPIDLQICDNIFMKQKKKVIHILK